MKHTHTTHTTHTHKMAHTPTMTLLLTDATSATLAERARLAYTNQTAEVSDATSAVAATIVAAEAATTTTITPEIMPAVTREVITMDRYEESDEEKEQQNPDATNFNNPKVWKSMGHSNPIKAAKKLGSELINEFCEQIALNIPSDKTLNEKCKWLTWELKYRKMRWNGEMITVIQNNCKLPQHLFHWFQKKLNSYCETDQFPKYPCKKAARKRNYYNRVNHSGSRGLQSHHSFGHTQHQDSSLQLMHHNIDRFSPTLKALLKDGKLTYQEAVTIIAESMMSYSMHNTSTNMSTNTNSMDTSSQGNKSKKSKKSKKSIKYKKHDYENASTKSTKSSKSSYW